MGSMNPISGILNTVTNKSEYKNAQQSYANSERAIAANDALSKQKLELEAEKDASDRRNALQKAVAKQRAAFGGQGIDTNDGSGEAVLTGLFKQNDEEKSYSDRLDNIRRQTIEQDTAEKRQRNLLDLQGKYNQYRSGFFNLIS